GGTSLADELRWRTIKAEDFAFELPAQPERLESDRVTSMGSIHTIRYKARGGLGILWDVSRSRLPERMLRQPPEIIFDASWRGGYGSDAGARPGPGPLPGNPITLKARWPGRRYQLRGGLILTSSAFYLVGDTLYAFHYLRSSQARDEALFDRLLSSFRLSKQ